MDEKTRRILAGGGTTSLILLALLGGLALVVRSLKGVDLSLTLGLRKEADDDDDGNAALEQPGFRTTTSSRPWRPQAGSAP